MSVMQLHTPIFDGGIKSINFFNGRLLSGEDLSQEQIANQRAHQQLSQIMGEGIAYGLEVAETAGASTPNSPIVTVTAGLALNRLGQTIELTSNANVALVRPPKAGGASDPALFSDCQPPQSGAYVTGEGVYLLTIQPATGMEGRAPVSGLGNIDAGCNRRYQVNGVQFRLIQLNISADILADTSHLRNRIAHLCFGTNDVRMSDFVRNPFGPLIKGYGLLDDLRPDCLADAEVPLAVLYWKVTDGIRFIDRWAVQRRITHPSADASWPLLLSDRRTAEAEAMFLQFQDQIEEMRSNPKENLASIIATDRFQYLPPVGLLPLGTNGRRGFDYIIFFSQMKYRKPIFIEGAQIRPLFQEGFNYPPIDTSSEIVVWLYVVRENAQATLSSAQPPQAYLVFASGHTPYRGEARYNVHHWNFGNFA